jgi:dihydropteroate synthase
MQWQTSRRVISLERPLVMAIINVTPDSFSDGGLIASVDDAVRAAEIALADGADLLDIGGESTRPGSGQVPADEEIRRTAPVIDAIAKRLDAAISIDTAKSSVARAAVDSGAEIINDISGLRWDPVIAAVAAEAGAGLMLMHSRGEFATMHSQPPVADIFTEVTGGMSRSIATAAAAGVSKEQILLDIGIGFGKTLEQNLQLIGGLARLIRAFPDHGVLVGTSRKSFIGKVTGEEVPERRLAGSLASAAIAVINGASVIRAHDVAATVQAVRIAEAIRAAADIKTEANILE